MTLWTPPSHVAAGDASSSQFNTETVDNLMHLWERIGRVVTFSGSKAVANGTGTATDVDTLAEVIENGDLDYGVAAGVITLNTGGLYLAINTASWGTSLAGTTRLVSIVGSSLGAAWLPVTVPVASSAGFGTGASAVRGVAIPAGETLTARARQDSGGSLSCNVHLTLVYLGPI